MGAHGVDLHEISVWDASSRTSIQALWTDTEYPTRYTCRGSGDPLDRTSA